MVLQNKDSFAVGLLSECVENYLLLSEVLKNDLLVIDTAGVHLIAVALLHEITASLQTLKVQNILHAIVRQSRDDNRMRLLRHFWSLGSLFSSQGALALT